MPKILVEDENEDNQVQRRSCRFSHRRLGIWTCFCLFLWFQNPFNTWRRNAAVTEANVTNFVFFAIKEVDSELIFTAAGQEARLFYPRNKYNVVRNTKSTDSWKFS